MLRKIIPFALILACLLCACATANTNGSENSGSDASLPTSKPDESMSEVSDGDGYEALLDALPQKNYAGYEFVIATSREGRFFANEDSADIVDKAVLLRNKAVEQKYGIKIVEKAVAESEIANKIEEFVSSGNQYADLVSASMPTLATLASSGGLVSLPSLPYYDYDGEYIDKSLQDGASAGSKQYITFDSLAQIKESAMCVFFNKNVVNADEIYKISKNGWTWEEFAGYAAEKKFAYYYEGDGLITTAFLTSGEFPVKGGLGSPLSYNQSPEILDEIAKKTKELWNNGGKTAFFGDSAKEKLLNGEIGFLIAPLSFVHQIKDSDAKFGVLCLPSFDESVRSVLGPDACGIAVPNPQTDSDRTGLILSALTAASYRHLEKAQIETLFYFAMPDNQSALNLYKIFESVSLDVGTVYSDGFSAINNASQKAILDAVKSNKKFENMFKNEQNRFEETAIKYFK